MQADSSTRLVASPAVAAARSALRMRGTWFGGQLWAQTGSRLRGEVCSSLPAAPCLQSPRLRCVVLCRDVDLHLKSSWWCGAKALFEASLLPGLRQNSFCEEMWSGAYMCTHPARRTRERDASTHTCVFGAAMLSAGFQRSKSALPNYHLLHINDSLTYCTAIS